MNVALTLPVALPLAAAALTILLRSVVAQRAVSLGASAAVLAVATTLVSTTAGGSVRSTQVGGWPAGFAIPLVADAFSALLLTVAALMVLVCTAYAAASREDLHRLFHPLVQVLSAGVFGSFLTGDLFNLFVFFEVMLIASYVLLTLQGNAEQVRAGAVYISVNLLASTVLLGGIALLYGVTGTVNLGALHGVAAEPGSAAVAAGVIAVAVAVKASVVPLHGWLPRAYPAASPAVTALFSGLLTKAGVYLLFRLYSVVFTGAPGYRVLLLVAATVTMVVGVLGAVGRDDIRGILSFHMVSQIGYLILPLGVFTLAGVAAGLFYLLQYIVVKGALFLAAGATETLGGSGRLDRLGGIALHHPLLGLAFMVAALSLAGIPPLSGFFGKLLLVRAAFDSGAFAAGGVAVAVSLFTLLSMVKIWNGAFWGESPKTSGQRQVELDMPVPAGGSGTDATSPVRVLPPALSRRRVAALIAPAMVLAAITVGAGLAAEPLHLLTIRAAGGLLDPAAYVEAVLSP